MTEQQQVENAAISSLNVTLFFVQLFGCEVGIFTQTFPITIARSGKFIFPA